MEPRQRLPGLREGQIYTYPSKRWRKKRRQYLINFMQPRYPVRQEAKEEDQLSAISVEAAPFPPPPPPICFNEDSKDSTKDDSKPVSLQKIKYIQKFDIDLNTSFKLILN